MDLSPFSVPQLPRQRFAPGLPWGKQLEVNLGVQGGWGAPTPREPGSQSMPLSAPVMPPPVVAPKPKGKEEEQSLSGLRSLLSQDSPQVASGYSGMGMEDDTADLRALMDTTVEPATKAIASHQIAKTPSASADPQDDTAGRIAGLERTQNMLALSKIFGDAGATIGRAFMTGARVPQNVPTGYSSENIDRAMAQSQADEARLRDRIPSGLMDTLGIKKDAMPGGLTFSQFQKISPALVGQSNRAAAEKRFGETQAGIASRHQDQLAQQDTTNERAIQGMRERFSESARKDYEVATKTNREALTALEMARGILDDPKLKNARDLVPAVDAIQKAATGGSRALPSLFNETRYRKGLPGLQDWLTAKTSGAITEGDRQDLRNLVDQMASTHKGDMVSEAKKVSATHGRSGRDIGLGPDEVLKRVNPDAAPQIFEADGQKYRVQPEHLQQFLKGHPGARAMGPE
jgi:hypothetical protein